MRINHCRSQYSSFLFLMYFTLYTTFTFKIASVAPGLRTHQIQASIVVHDLILDFFPKTSQTPRPTLFVCFQYDVVRASFTAVTLVPPLAFSLNRSSLSMLRHVSPKQPLSSHCFVKARLFILLLQKRLSVPQVGCGGGRGEDQQAPELQQHKS